MATQDREEPFLDRWSRLKEEARKEAPAQNPAAKAPESPADLKDPPHLPPVDELTFESDYRAFFHPKVSEDTRRAALKKLFSDPRFNVMDGLDVYIDDYSKTEPIPPAMLAGLRQAQRIFEWAKGEQNTAPAARTGPEPVEGAQPAALEPPAAPASPAPDGAERITGNNPSVADRASGSRSSGNA
jgi:hypothetical protein